MTGRVSRTRPPRSEEGYVLLVFLLFSALLVIGASRILPKALFQGQREREEEMIFRGQQYQRAIQLFVRKFGRYPNSLEELENTNEIRFLRKRYRDPVTQEGEWRMIHIGPGGVFPDALNPPTPQANLGTLPVSGLSPSQTGSREEEGSFPQPSPFGSVAGEESATLLQAPGAPDPSGQPAVRLSATPAATPSQQPRVAASTRQPAAPQVFGGEGIAGVASLSTADAIKVWNGRSSYNEWEFIFDFRSDPLAMAAIARVSSATAQPPGQPETPEEEEPSSPSPQLQNQPYQPPRWQGPGGLGGPAPGIRPLPRQFPPSPIPGTSPTPKQK